MSQSSEMDKTIISRKGSWQPYLNHTTFSSMQNKMFRHHRRQFGQEASPLICIDRKTKICCPIQPSHLHWTWAWLGDPRPCPIKGHTNYEYRRAVHPATQQWGTTQLHRLHKSGPSSFRHPGTYSYPRKFFRWEIDQWMTKWRKQRMLHQREVWFRAGN